MTDKPTPPDGYEVRTWLELPDEVPSSCQYWAEERWLPSSLQGCSKDRIISNVWYAVPVQKPDPSNDAKTHLELHLNAHALLSQASTALDTQVGGNHYQRFTIQPAEFIIKNNIGFAEGAVIKYVCRHGEKNGAEDLDKAIHYLQILKEMKYGKA